MLTGAFGLVGYVRSRYTVGGASTSFTSTSMTLNPKQEYALIRKEVNPTKKGYVQLLTNMGNLNIELHCDIVPRTCENFLGLCAKKYYDGVIFHRSIKNFMIQV